MFVYLWAWWSDISRNFRVFCEMKCAIVIYPDTASEANLFDANRGSCRPYRISVSRAKKYTCYIVSARGNEEDIVMAWDAPKSVLNPFS